MLAGNRSISSRSISVAIPCRRCDDAVQTSTSVGVADAVGEQPRRPDDAVAVAGDRDVLGLLERAPERRRRAAVVELVGDQVFLRTAAQSMPSSELSIRMLTRPLSQADPPRS